MSDRKYRQRGYQDSDRDRAPSRSVPTPPQSERETPRGRGLGRPEREVFRCRDCGQAANPAEVELDSTCTRCRAALHACVNCRSFDPSARWECRAEIEAPVRSKTKLNQCALFAAKVVLELGAPERDDDPRAAFEALFR